MKIQKFLSDPIYKNSSFLMLNAGALSGFGFLFWIIATKLLNSTDIGNATAILGATNLMANLGLIGAESGLLRFLPDSNNKERKINTVTLVSLIGTLLACIIYMAFIEQFSPKLHQVLNTILLMSLFVLIAVFTSLNNILDAIFTSLKKSEFVFARGLFFGVLKIALIFAFYRMGTKGLLYSFMIPSLSIIALGYLFTFYSFKFKPWFSYSKEVISKIAKYSIHNYISGLAGTATGSLMPIIIINNLGAKYSAYYYFSVMVNTALASIPTSSSSSFMAVLSDEKANIFELYKKTVMFVGKLVIPAAILIIVFGKLLLLAFGWEYSQNAYPLLALLALSTVLSSLNSVSATVLNFCKKSFLVTKISIFYAAVLLFSSYHLIKLGLVGIGIAYVMAHLCVNLFYIYYLIKNKELIFQTQK